MKIKIHLSYQILSSHTLPAADNDNFLHILGPRNCTSWAIYAGKLLWHLPPTWQIFVIPVSRMHLKLCAPPTAQQQKHQWGPVGWAVIIAFSCLSSAPETNFKCLSRQERYS